MLPTHGFNVDETLLNDLDSHYGDALKLIPQKSDPLRDFLSTHLPRTIRHSKLQRDFIDHVTTITSKSFTRSIT